VIRPTQLLAGVTGLIIALALPGGAVSADREDAVLGKIGTEVLEDFRDPPGANKNAASYVNPCLGHEGYEAHVSKSTGISKNSTKDIGYELSGETKTLQTSVSPGDVLGFSFVTDPTFEVEYVQWLTACATDEAADPSGFEAGTIQLYWIRRPTQEGIISSLFAGVIEQLKAPEISWPNKDPEFGWVYVTVENDIRISPVEAVREQVTVSNLLGSVTAWVQATPSRIEFVSGEPGSTGAECSYESATAPFTINAASYCFYRYENSSSIGTEVPNAFLTRTTLFWEITSSGPLTYNQPESWRQEAIQVAAVQAIEIANP